MNPGAQKYFFQTLALYQREVLTMSLRLYGVCGGCVKPFQCKLGWSNLNNSFDQADQLGPSLKSIFVEVYMLQVERLFYPWPGHL